MTKEFTEKEFIPFDDWVILSRIKQKEYLEHFNEIELDPYTFQKALKSLPMEEVYFMEAHDWQKFEDKLEAEEDEELEQDDRYDEWRDSQL